VDEKFLVQVLAAAPTTKANSAEYRVHFSLIQHLQADKVESEIKNNKNFSNTVYAEIVPSLLA
jgi:hypothetical protein